MPQWQIFAMHVTDDVFNQIIYKILLCINIKWQLISNIDKIYEQIGILHKRKYLWMPKKYNLIAQLHNNL
jgi:hypothetical protein